jgi:hypothetical protein
MTCNGEIEARFCLEPDAVASMTKRALVPTDFDDDGRGEPRIKMVSGTDVRGDDGRCARWTTRTAGGAEDRAGVFRTGDGLGDGGGGEAGGEDPGDWSSS